MVPSGILKAWEGEMNTLARNAAATLILAGALSLGSSAGAQQSAQSDLRRLQTYEVSRELSVIGTVVKYEPASSVAPIGAHLLLQTASGPLDVHLGNAKLLQASHFDLNSGDNVRVVGESLALDGGTFFAARIVQKGTQAVAVRNTKGFPLLPASALTPAQKEALGGVR
jgi:hypothetical protein